MPDRSPVQRDLDTTALTRETRRLLGQLDAAVVQLDAFVHDLAAEAQARTGGRDEETRP
jgi:hypothetical protein